MHSEKPPRRYAFDFIAAGPDKEKQRQAVAGCPKEWQEYVRYLIKYIKEKNTMRAKQCLKSQ